VLFEQIEATGIAHYSYLIGDGDEVAVIDPRRDPRVYADLAARRESAITTILETHRNEDYVIGSAELAAATDAEVWHADGRLPYQYGRAAEPGQAWRVGRLTVEALTTPGHTPGSLSYLVRDPSGRPWIVFTGDTLFAGDVGRVDLPDGEDLEGRARMLHAALFEQLLPLGDEVIVGPGHGAGSVCGAAIGDRTLTTIGLERKHNPKLQATAVEDFVAAVAVHGHRPSYFRQVEALNLSGARLPEWFPAPEALGPDAFAVEMDGALVVDVRSELAFGAAHVPGSLSIWLRRVGQWAGQLIPARTPLLLVAESADEAAEAATLLLRLGFDDIRGQLGGGIGAWAAAGRDIAATELVDSDRLDDRMPRPAVLDVRTPAELGDDRITGAAEIPLVDLPERLAEVPSARPLLIVCSGGPRSMMAASLLERAGLPQAAVVVGGTRARAARREGR